MRLTGPHLHGPDPRANDRPSVSVQVTEFLRCVDVVVVGEIDYTTAPVVQHVLARYLGRERNVIADLSQVTFADCAALHLLERARRRDPEFRLFAPSPSVRRLMELTGTTIPCYVEDTPQPA